KTHTAGTPAKEREIVPAASSVGGVEQFPLTESQKEIWLAAQMGGEAALGYNESLKLEFHGSFNAELFRAAIQQIVQRHPILLVSFSSDGQWQRVDPAVKLDVPVLDFSAKQRPAQELEKLIETEVSSSFDLTQGPLMRIRS